MTDKYIEKFKTLDTYMAAYMRDVTYAVHPSIQIRDGSPKVIGRAYTVNGPDVYMNALESIPKDVVYVHGGAHETDGVWCGAYAEYHDRRKGLLGVVTDGGITIPDEPAERDIPTFARFTTPRPAINRKEGEIQVPIICGGVPVNPGDIILGDGGGVVVIPQRNQDEIFSKMDAFYDAVGLFVEIFKEEAKGTQLTKHRVLGELFKLKYENPNATWRCYEGWAKTWRDKWRG